MASGTPSNQAARIARLQAKRDNAIYEAQETQAMSDAWENAENDIASRKATLEPVSNRIQNRLAQLQNKKMGLILEYSTLTENQIPPESHPNANTHRGLILRKKLEDTDSQIDRLSNYQKLLAERLGSLESKYQTAVKLKNIWATNSAGWTTRANRFADEIQKILNP